MRNDLGNLRGEDEISGSLLVPACDRRGAWRAIKCAIDLDCLKLAGVVAEKILRAHALRIEGTFPTSSGERRSAEKDAGQGEWTFGVWLVCGFRKLFQFKQSWLKN